MPYRFDMACRTESGPRPGNEDSVRVEPDLQFAVVADGMGGAAGGQKASNMAVDIATGFLERHLVSRACGKKLPQLLASLVADVNDEIRKTAENSSALRGMGTTLVLAVFQNGQYCVANVGDSRAYRIRGGEIHQLTRDHSLVQARIDAGLIPADEVSSQPDRNVITRAVGVAPTVQPDIACGELQGGDTFVLTSDGVHGVVSRDSILESASQGSAQGIAGRLVESALARGTRDNATAAVVRVDQARGRRLGSGFESMFQRALSEANEKTRRGPLGPWVWVLVSAVLAMMTGVAAFPFLRRLFHGMW